MQRTSLPSCCRLVAGLALLLAGACGQNEGGRCQINSDCASGLMCQDGTTGNGRCVSTLAGTTSDAALGNDVAVTEKDSAPAADATDVLVSAPDLAPDVAAAEVPTVTPVDADSTEAGGID